MWGQTPTAALIRVDENTIKLSSVAAIGGEGKIYKLDEDEFINVEKIPLDKAVEMVLNNRIFDGKTQTAVLKTAMLLKAAKNE